MEVAYTHREYRELAKEVCFLVNDLRQLSDIICSKELFDELTTQANATCSAIGIVDQLKNYLVQMNFLTCNAASGLKEGEVDAGLIEYGRMDNNDTSSCDTGDNMELHNVTEGDNTVLEDSQTGPFEEGNQEDTEILE